MKIGFLQYNPVLSNVDKNIKKIVEILKNYYHDENNLKPDLLVLPELALTGYAFEKKESIMKITEKYQKIIQDKFIELSKLYNTAFIIGISEKVEQKLFNSAVLITEEGIKKIYRKAHLFGDEKKLFDESNNKFEIITYKNCKIGILVCFDHMFPEAARSLAIKGAQIVCHPSNLVLPELAQLTTRVRSIENRIYWVLANRTGFEYRGEEKLFFTGKSQITGPTGEILTKAGSDEKVIKVININPGDADNKYITKYNNILSDRRKDLYNI